MVCARDATEGLKELEARAPDVVLSDIAMPGTDGHDFLRRVRALPRTRGGKIPAVAITAYTSREARLSSREAGYHYHLTKPYDVEKLTEILAGLVRLTRS
jgi:CheY-like chemotaxis protein